MGDEIEPVALALCKALASWFPELEGRVVAVSETEITLENVPTFPIAIVAFIRGDGKDSWKGNAPAECSDEYLIQYIVKSERYKLNGTTELPFWKFFNFEPKRRILCSRLKGWVSPVSGRWEYKSCDVESSTTDISLSFRFVHHHMLCPVAFDDDKIQDAPLHLEAFLVNKDDAAFLRVNPNTCEVPCGGNGEGQDAA